MSYNSACRYFQELVFSHITLRKRIDRVVGGTAYTVGGANGGVHWCYRYQRVSYDSYDVGFQHDDNDYWCTCYSLYQQFRITNYFDLPVLSTNYKSNVKKFVNMFYLIADDVSIWEILVQYFCYEQRSDTPTSLREDWLINCSKILKRVN